MVPTRGDMVQVRAGVVPVDAVTVNCLLCPGPSETVAGEIDKVTAGTRVTTAETFTDESDVDVAVTVTVCDAVIEAGAV